MAASNGDTLAKSFLKVAHDLVYLLRNNKDPAHKIQQRHTKLSHEDCEVVIGEAADGFLLPSSKNFVYSQCLTSGGGNVTKHQGCQYPCDVDFNLYAEHVNDWRRYESPVIGNVVTPVGAPVAWRPRIIDTAVATPLRMNTNSNNLVALHFKYDQARRRFVEWAQNEIVVVPDFHRRILFSDEAHFWLNGYVNKQNCRIWSEANPQVYVETPLHPEKLTVWCALWAGGILLQKR
ncbi:hypothetical protein TNCV_5029562 [Trichonephila clavipes]|nr:hypothetical protein TNCV_5029562 [Trichonephila clavipes]